MQGGSATAQVGGGVTEHALACPIDASDAVLGNDEAGGVVAVVSGGVVVAIGTGASDGGVVGGEVDFVNKDTCRVIACRRSAARSAHALLP